LALTRTPDAKTPDPNRPTTRDPDSNRSTSILYIVDWRMVAVEGRNVLHHVKKRGNQRELSGAICPGKMTGS